MLFSVYQQSRVDLQGAAFFDVLQQFRGEELAVLYSADAQGQSVIARNALITFSAEEEGSRARIKAHPSLAWFCPESPGEPLIEQLRSLMTSVHISSTVNLLGGWIGQIGYDIGRSIETIPARAINDLHWPMLHWRYFDEYYIYHHAAKLWTLITSHWPTRTDPYESRLAAMSKRVMNPGSNGVWQRDVVSTLLESMPREQYCEKVQRIKDYIAAGDIYQANFAQRWKAQTFADPLDIFRSLSEHSPSPLSALLTFDNRAAISASPELLLHHANGHLITRPIKGTRPRCVDDEQRDFAARDELVNSEKDKAELAMIVDLLRNDLGRVALYGSVRVTDPRAIEQHPTVWHTVATIEADVAQGKEWSDIIRALCPGGSITGAPKIRAMQIIEELEPYRRGLYCGNIGTPSMLNIAIRTIQMIDSTAYIYAGGGIVADSDPQKEYEECLHKAAALFKSLNLKID